MSGDDELRKKGMDLDSNSGLVVVVGSMESMCCVCWRDETTLSTVVLCGVDREREEALDAKRKRERVMTVRREKNLAKAIFRAKVMS